MGGECEDSGPLSVFAWCGADFVLTVAQPVQVRTYIFLKVCMCMPLKVPLCAQTFIDGRLAWFRARFHAIEGARLLLGLFPAVGKVRMMSDALLDLCV